jgi:hypothetical protein
MPRSKSKRRTTTTPRRSSRSITTRSTTGSMRKNQIGRGPAGAEPQPGTVISLRSRGPNRYAELIQQQNYAERANQAEPDREKEQDLPGNSSGDTTLSGNVPHRHGPSSGDGKHRLWRQPGKRGAQERRRGRASENPKVLPRNKRARSGDRAERRAGDGAQAAPWFTNRIFLV